MVDKILSRGGMISMYGVEVAIIIILSATMGAVLEKSEVIKCLVKDVVASRQCTNRANLDPFHNGILLFSVIYLQDQVMPIILGGRTFRPA